MDKRALWKLNRETLRAIVPTYEGVFERFCEKARLDSWAFGLLLAALTFEPESITPARLQVRGPYTAASGYLEQLAAAAESGYLDEVVPGEFRLTPWSTAEVTRVVEDARAAMAEADPLPLDDSHRLATLLDQLMQASLDTPPPPGAPQLQPGETWSITLCQRLMPARTPPLPYSEQAISCLSGYRDDAHLAAWQPSGLSATALEALTLLWSEEADSLEALSQKLHRRGHPPQVYAEALAELRERGFIRGSDDAPRLTGAGESFRDQVERDTDRFFFAPWDCLDAAEKTEFAGLLTRLRDGLAKPRV